MNRIAILLAALGGLFLGGLLLEGADAQQSPRTIRWFCFAMDADGEFPYIATVGSASRATAEAYARGQAEAGGFVTGVVSCGSEYEQRARALFAPLDHTHGYADAGHTHAAAPAPELESTPEPETTPEPSNAPSGDQLPGAGGDEPPSPPSNAPSGDQLPGAGGDEPPSPPSNAPSGDQLPGAGGDEPPPPPSNSPSGDQLPGASR